MRARTAAGLTIAPLRLRLLAGFLRVLPGLSALVGGFVMAGKFAHVDTARWKPLTKKLEGISERVMGFDAAWSGATRASALYHRNASDPISRLVGIRRVDARTGGPITARQALTRAVLIRSPMEMARLQSAEMRRRTRAIEPEIAKVREAHQDDERAAQREVMALYQKHRVDMFSSCGWYIVPAFVMVLPALIPPRHQTLPDLLAGTVVVVDR